MIPYITALLVALAGVLHFLAVPERLAANTVLGILFVMLGVIQLAYASVLVHKRTHSIIVIGILFNTTLLALWLLSQTLPHLAGSSREPLTLFSGLRKAFELLSVELLRTQLHPQTPKS
jgi:hypothetical protein